MHFPQTWQSDGGAPVPPVVVAAAQVELSNNQVVHQEMRCAEIRLQNELSWMLISDDGHDCSRAI